MTKNLYVDQVNNNYQVAIKQALAQYNDARKQADRQKAAAKFRVEIAKLVEDILTPSIDVAKLVDLVLAKEIKFIATYKFTSIEIAIEEVAKFLADNNNSASALIEAIAISASNASKIKPIFCIKYAI